MNISELTYLRQQIERLAENPEWRLLAKYDLLAGKPLKSLKDRAYRFARRLLAKVGVLPPYVTRFSWQATLKHAPKAEGAKTLLIWALGTPKEELRQACASLADRLVGDTEWVPVLVTDVADFAFFSRLGWLVEYLPELSGEGESYRERKKRYLAWRYRGAVIVPVSLGLANEASWPAAIGMRIRGSS